MITIIKDEEIKMISYDHIIPCKLNSYDTSDIEDLAGNISYCGLITPLTVIGPNEEGKYIIMSGERRYKAITEIRKKEPERFNEIPCLICGSSNMSENEQRLLIESANTETRSVKVNERRFEIIKILFSMAEADIISQKDIVKEAEKYIQCSDRYRRMYLKIFKNQNKELQDLVINNEVYVSDAAYISGLDKEEQKEIIEQIKNGENAKDAIKKKKKEGKKEKTKEDSTDNNQESDKSDDGFDMFSDEVFDSMMNGDVDDLEEAFFSSQMDTSVQAMDTSGKIDSLMNSTDTSDRSDKEAYAVIKWCKKMMYVDYYTEAEEKALEAMRKLLMDY